MHSSRLSYLFLRYYHKTASAAEKQEMLELLGSASSDDQLQELLKEAWEEPDTKDFTLPEKKRLEILEAILSHEAPVERVSEIKALPIQEINHPRFGWTWWKIAAACLLLLSGAGLSYRWFKERQDIHIAATQASGDILPGSNKAMLVLGDGSTIDLNKALQGHLSTQSGALVLKADSGQLAYQATGGSLSDAPVFNTLVTPKGGQYKIVLADGTKVWLNASSSLTFPTAFQGKDRRVTVTGEAYFEVARRPNQPFFVAVSGSTIEVLGTHFNVNAYADEALMATTLLEGAVKVTGVHGGQATLKPGEQAELSETATTVHVMEVDTAAIIAWKNEQFSFNDSDLKEVMKQLSRWYDIDVTYEGTVSAKLLRGNVSRNYPISEVLKMLAFTAGIRYTIEGNKVLIYQN
jgi:transmembrane sensor